jgi:spore germination cell wall hydrolase CwlJ-like protein
MKKLCLALGVVVVLWIAGVHWLRTSRERSVAAVLIAEAGGEGRAGMEAVAEVILNRHLHSKRSYMQIISKRKAFSCLNNTSKRRLRARAARHPRYQEALAIARTLFRHPDALPRRLNGADHYARSEVQPYWTIGASPVAVIGHHTFWKLGS